MHTCTLCNFSSTRDEEKVVILDEKIDALLPSVRDFILKHKLDPARIPSIIEDLLPHLVSNYSTNNGFWFFFF